MSLATRHLVTVTCYPIKTFPIDINHQSHLVIDDFVYFMHSDTMPEYWKDSTAITKISVLGMTMLHVYAKTWIDWVTYKPKRIMTVWVYLQTEKRGFFYGIKDESDWSTKGNLKIIPIKQLLKIDEHDEYLFQYPSFT